MATPSQTPDKSNRAVVAFADGRRLRGYIFDFSAIKDSFRLSPEEDPAPEQRGGGKDEGFEGGVLCA